MGWAVFLVVAPLDLLVTFSFLWVPAFLLFEWLRGQRHGFLPGGPVRILTVVGTVAAAWWAPIKADDSLVGPLPRVETTLGELQFFGVISLGRNSRRAGLHVQLPSVTPTRAELEAAIRDQTGLQVWSMGCGTSANVLLGVWVGAIHVYDERQAMR